MIGNIHSQMKKAPYTEMFSCVQEPPLMASPPAVDWCGRLLGHTREETTICIKGVPGDFAVDQPEHTDNEGALYQPDNKRAVDTPHEPSATHPPAEADAPSVNQFSDVPADMAKCQRAVTNLFECDHVVTSYENFSTKHVLPLPEADLDKWRFFLGEVANPGVAEEMIKYFQAETRELVNRNVEAALFSYKICRCKVVEPETQKYIKCTVFIGVTESNIPRRHPQGCHIF